MKLSDFDYNLPKKLIAQEPIRPRDHSRLLVLRRASKDTECLRSVDRRHSVSFIEHKHFYDIIDYLHKGDVLVLNNSKVFPARLIGKREGTGGKVEVFLLRHLTSQPPNLNPSLSFLRRGGEGEVWQCLVGGPRRKVGVAVEFGLGLKCEIIADNQDGTWNAKFNKTGKTMVVSQLNTVGIGKA